MDVIIDGKPDFEVQGEPESALAVVVAASEFLREQRRAILALEVDGQAIPADGVVAALEERPVESVETVVITTEDVHTLVDTCLAELEDALPDLPEACHNLAEIFQGDDPESGFEPFYQLAEIWRHIKIREIQVVHALDLDLDALQSDGLSFKAMHDELNKFLSEAAEALETADCVLLGDLLEYELAPRAEAEAEIVALLRAQAAQQPE